MYWAVHGDRIRIRIRLELLLFNGDRFQRSIYLHVEMQAIATEKNLGLLRLYLREYLHSACDRIGFDLDHVLVRSHLPELHRLILGIDVSISC